jgi:hypothetical protein
VRLFEDIHSADNNEGATNLRGIKMRFMNVSLVRALFLFLIIAGALAMILGIISPHSIALADDTGWDLPAA